MLHLLQFRYFKAIALAGIIACLQLCPGITYADSVVWNFTALTSAAASSTNANVPTASCTAAIGNSFGSVSTPINTTSASSGYTGATGGGNIGNAVAVVGNSTFNSGTSPYISFTLTPNSGYYISVTGMSFGSRSTSTGPQAYSVSTSVGGFSSAIASGAFPNNSVWNLYTPSFSTVTGAANTAIEVRIYAYGGSGSASSGTENWRLDDISFNITVSAAAAPPSFITNPSGFTICTGNSNTFNSSASGSPTYQWQRNSGSGFVNITSSSMDAGITYAGFTTGTLTVTPATTAANGYQYQVVATNSFGSAISSSATLTVNATPVVSPLTGGATSLCTSGSTGTTTFSDATTGGAWLSTNPAAATVTGGTVTGVAAGTAVISYTLTSGSCSNAATATVNVTASPSALSVSPSVTVCQGSPVNTLTASGGTVITPVTATRASGTINLQVSAAHAIATSSLSISGIPASAVITGVSAQIDFSSNFVNDYVINLVAPNGSIINLVNMEGPHGTGSYTGTVISSSGVTSLASGSSPFTGTYAADATTGAGPAGFLSNVAAWSSLYSVPNGSWTLVVYNNSTFTNSPTTLADWTINVSYTYPQQMPVIWSPVSNLFTNSGGTTPYTGANTLSVYENPLIPGVITYTATATNGGCTTIGTTTVTVNPLPLPIFGVPDICNGSVTTLSDPTPGGSWGSSNSSIATILSGSGLLIGSGAGTAVITYSLPTGCYVTTTETINPLPAVYNITGGGPYCTGGTGVHIGLNGSATGVSYQLYNGATPVGSPVTGTGSAIDFGLQTAIGTYEVEATNETTFCNSTMNGTVNVSTLPLPATHTVTGGGTYCAGGTGYHIGLNGSETGFTYQLYNGASAVGSGMAGTGSALDFGLQTVTGTYTVVATNNTTFCNTTMTGSAVITVNPLPDTHTVTGGGSYCSGGIGVHIGLNGSDAGINYQLYNGAFAVGSTTVGAGLALDFGLQTASGTYTITATNITTTCTSSMSGSATVSVNPLPVQYTVTGGGSYCSGGTGVDVMLNGSDTGISYQLYNGASFVGAATAGTGSSIDFGLKTTSGTYTVVATNNTTSCMSATDSNALVTILPLPALYNITGGGGYCAGGTGVNISLSNSDTGISYQLYNGSSAVGSALPGIHDVLNFGSHKAAGTYWVLAINNATSCSDTMTGTDTVFINPLPAVHAVTGGGSYCMGGAGVSVGLDGSDTGISYVVYRGTTGGSMMAGTGSTISFGSETVAGSYIVIATNMATFCTDTMADSAAITVLPLPAAHNVTGGGSYCFGGTGVHIGLDTADVGFTYQLYNGTSPVSAAMAGADTAIDFGAETSAGTYTVMATNTSTSCTSVMDGSATVAILPIVHPSVSIIKSTADTICAGSTSIFTAIPSFGGSSPSYQWRVNDTIVGIDSAAYAFAPQDSSRISVMLVSSHSCAVPATVMDSVMMRVLPNETPTLHIVATPGNIVCEGTPVTFVVHPAYEGSSPAYAWIKSGTRVSTSPSFTYVPSDSDDVYCFMNSSYLCRIHDSAFSDAIYMNVVTPIVPSVTITGRPGVTLAHGAPDTLVATVANGGPDPKYQWYINNSLVPAATSSIFIRTSYADKDSISCIVTRNDACAMSTINSVVIHLWRTGIDQLNAANIALVPNPNNGNFIIKGSLASVADKEISILITNMLGQTVYSDKIIARNGEINQPVMLDNNMAGGVYILNLHGDNGDSTFRFVVER